MPGNIFSPVFIGITNERGWRGVVPDYASLPPATGSGDTIMVLNSTGFLWNKRKGIYRDEAVGVWNRLSNTIFQVLDTESIIYDNLDNTKGMVFQVSGVYTGNIRILSMADRDVDLQLPTFDDVTIDGLTGNVITSESVETGMEELDLAIYDLIVSGWCGWGGSGNYYSVVGSTFTLLRPGEGRIRGKRIVWAGSQNVTLVANACNYIYINSSGILAVVQVDGIQLYQNNIVLFEALYDGTNVFVVKENHGCNMQVESSHVFHNTIGVVITSSTNNQAIGADITRVALGTGGVIGDRQLKIVGSALLQDHGLVTTILDSAGSPITINWYYTNAAGHWTRQSQQSQVPMVWNNAGVITALGAGKYANFRIYASKNDLNVLTPSYFAVIGRVEHSNLAAAQAAVNNGTVATYSNELYQLELAQLGIITVINSGGGYIIQVAIAKKTTVSGITTGSGSGLASGVNTNTTNFNRFYSPTDTTVQAALETGNLYTADIRLANIFALTQTMNRNIGLTNTTFANQYGIITKNSLPFIHNFNYGNNGVVTTLGENTFIGNNAGNLTMGATATSTSHASFNLFAGCNAGNKNTIGYSDVFLGCEAGANNTVGYGNTFTGQFSGNLNTIGFYNSAYGLSSLRNNTEGNYNCAFGFGSLFNNTLGNNNIAYGYNTLAANTIGSTNISMGFSSMASNVNGGSNLAIGGNSLLSNVDGSLNVVIGPNAFRSNVSGSTNVAIGSSAGRYETSSNTLYIDNQDRTDTAGDKSKAMMYGVFAAAPANQKLNINAELYVNGKIGIGISALTSPLQVIGIVEHADNAAALTAGLTTGAFYRTADILKVVH